MKNMKRKRRLSGNSKMNSTPLELILHDKVQQLLDNFASVMKIRTVFFTADGKLLRSGGRDKNNSAYCTCLQNHYFSLEKCVALDKKKQEESRKDHCLKCYRCHGGLHEVLSPVTANGKLAGFILFGQFRTTTKLPAAVLNRCKDDRERKMMTEKFLSLPFFEKESLENLLGLLQMMVDYIVAHELITLKRDNLYDEILSFIERNYRKNPSISDLARHLGKSVSGISHFLNERHAESFKTLLIRRKLQEADRLLKEQPHLPLKNIASIIGIEDHYYFSRLYKKYKGITPGTYRKTGNQ